MFTGIITGLGQITEVHPLGESLRHGRRLCIEAPVGYLEDVSLGDSIAIHGACMTVTGLYASAFSVDISTESLSKTTGLDRPGLVNLEKALRASDRLGGHLVSGHVDGTGRVTHFAQSGESWTLRLRCPLALAPYFAPKGSVAVNGVSLTINAVRDHSLGAEVEINLIPHTLHHTSLARLENDDTVNLEIDQIARYCERILSCQRLIAHPPDRSP